MISNRCLLSPKCYYMYTPCGSNSLLALYSLFRFLWQKTIAPPKCQKIQTWFFKLIWNSFHKDWQKIYEKHFLITFGRAIVFCLNKARRLLVPQGVCTPMLVLLITVTTARCIVQKVIAAVQMAAVVWIYHMSCVRVRHVIKHWDIIINHAMMEGGKRPCQLAFWLYGVIWERETIENFILH